MPTPKLRPSAENCSLIDLETAMSCTPTQQACLRMKAVRGLLIGQERRNIEAVFDVCPRTLNRWINAFNREGIDGLIDDPRPGRPRRLATEDTEKYRELVNNPVKAGELHWTAKKFHGYLCNQLNEEVGYRTVVRWLHEQDFALRVPRPWPNRQDKEKREQYLNSLRDWLLNDSIDLWYSDESGFEGDPRPRRRWVEIGSRPTRVKNGDHLRINVIGAVLPRTGEFFSIEVDTCNSDSFQAFLDEAQKEIVLERPTNYLILDNASWHKMKSTCWGKFTPIYLPAYSPDFNPIERLWLLIKDEFFSDFVAKTYEELMHQLDRALIWASSRTGLNQKTCTIKTKL